MPNSVIYDKDGGVKVDPLSSGRIINVQYSEGDSANTIGLDVTDCHVSCCVVEQYHKVFLRESLEADPHGSSLSGTKNGDNTPYSDQRGAVSTTPVPGSRKNA